MNPALRFLALLSLPACVFAWTPIVRSPDAINGIGRVQVVARGMTGSATYPTILLAGEGRPTSAPTISARLGVWNCYSGTDAWTCRRDLPVGSVADDTLDISWGLTGATTVVDSIRNESGAWRIWMSKKISSPTDPKFNRDFSILGLQSVQIADRIKIPAGFVAAGTVLQVGVEDTLRDVIGNGSVNLRDRAHVKGHLTYGQTLQLGNNVVVQGGSERYVTALPAIDSLSCAYGTTDKNISSGTVTLAPGAYQNVLVSNGATLVLTAGLYQVRSLSLQPGVKVTLAPGTGVIDVRAAVQFEVGDNIKMSFPANTNPQAVRWTHKGISTLRLGTDGEFFGWFRAPWALIDVNSRSRVTGALHAQNVTIQPDCYGVYAGVVNQAPSLSGSPIDTGRSGRAWAFSPVATDPEGEVLTWSLESKPTGATINAVTGVVSWIPSIGGIGFFELKVCDATGDCARMAWVVTAAASNSAPQFTSTAITSATENVAYSYTAVATDSDGDALTWTGDSVPTGATFNTTTHVLTWTPTYSQSGSFAVKLKVKDPSGDSAIQRFTIVVANKNRVPAFTSMGVTTATENVAYSYTATASDADGDALTWTGDSLPVGATINTTTHVLSWTPTYTQSGSFAVKLKVKDPSGDSAIQRFTIVVANKNRVPAFTSMGVTTATENVAFTYTATATDGDGDALTWTGDSIPTGATFNTTTHVLSWTPTYSQSGNHSVKLKVKDASGDSAIQRFTIVVANVNRTPYWSKYPKDTAKAGVKYQDTIKAVDPDGDAIRYRIVSAPTGLTLDSLTGVIVWTPDSSSPRVNRVQLKAEDVLGGSVIWTDTIWVKLGSNVPMIISKPPTSFLVVWPQQVPLLSVVLRDFSRSHVDFGLISENREKGIVDSRLGSDGTPIYSGPTGRGQVFSDSTFKQWYHDEPGVNQTFRTFVLSTIVGNNLTRRFSMTPFSPLDSLGFGKEGLPHNRSLTGEIHTSITSHNAAAKIAFSTMGNYWLFLDGKLVQDGDTASSLNLKDYGVDTGVEVRLDAFVALRSTTMQDNWFRFDATYCDVQTGDQYEYPLIAVDETNTPLSYQIINGPVGMHVVPSQGVVRWDPGVDQGGIYSVTVRVTNGLGLGADQTWNLRVGASVNRPPVITSAAAAVATKDSAYRYQLSAEDLDYDPLTYRLLRGPSGMTVSSTGLVSWSPSAITTDSVVLEVNDGRGGIDQQRFILRVGNQGASTPVIISEPQLAFQVKGPIPNPNLQVTLRDFSSQNPEFSLAVENMEKGVVRSALGLGGFPVFSGPSGRGGITSDSSFKLWYRDAIGVNRAFSTVVNSSLVGNSGSTRRYQSTPFNPLDGVGFGSEGWTHNRSYTGEIRTRVLSRNARAALSFNCPGMYWVFVDGELVKDGSNGYDLILKDAGVDSGEEKSLDIFFSLRSMYGDNSLNLDATRCDLFANDSSVYQYQVIANDQTGTPLSYKLIAGPHGMRIDENRGTLYWQPSWRETGRHRVIVEVANGLGKNAQQEFYLTAWSDANHLPVFVSKPQERANFGVLYTYTPICEDQDANRVTYKLLEAPVGAWMDPVSGQLSWTPTFGGLISAKVKIQADDGSGGLAYQEFEIHVRAQSDSTKPKIVSVPVVNYSDIFPSGERYTNHNVLTFPKGHRDFHDITPEDFSGMVAERLGDDGAPVFIGGAGVGGVHSGSSFYEWFHKVDSVNISSVRSLLRYTCTDIAG
ncbi:MAG: hypothetical protein RL173_2733, partial [Fibrobacterota bacterium]